MSPARLTALPLLLVAALAPACGDEQGLDPIRLWTPRQGAYEPVEYTYFDDTCEMPARWGGLWERGMPLEPGRETYDMRIGTSPDNFSALASSGLYLAQREAGCYFDGLAFECDVHREVEWLLYPESDEPDRTTTYIDSWMVGEWLDEETVVLHEFQRRWCVDHLDNGINPRCYIPHPTEPPCIRERSGTWVWDRACSGC